MGSPHVIRLRGPWDYEPLARCVLCPDGATREESTDLPASGRIQMPADWGATLGPDFRGRVRYVRRFGYPTGLEPHDRVWLVIDGADAMAAVRLNERLLGVVSGLHAPARFDVTSALKDRNRLVADVELPILSEVAEQARQARAGLPGGLVGEVRLEIESGER